MKNFLSVATVLTITALLFIGIACQPQHRPTEHMDTNEHYMDTNEHYMDTVPLIYHMSFMQRYATKLYFSGMAENWGLADIYAHEMEEIAETIIEGNHLDEDINISELLKTMLPAQIENIEAAIDARDKALFEKNYQIMIQTCNKCHVASDYGLVKVTVPETNPFAQDFAIQD